MFRLTDMLTARGRMRRRALLTAVVAVVATAGSAVASASFEGPTAGSAAFGPGPGGMLRPASDARARVRHGADRLRSAIRGYGAGRHGSRGHGFVRDAVGFARIDVPGASVTAAFGSNRRGQIVGGYVDGRRRAHGFVREGRRLRRIDFPGAVGTLATGINDRGRIVGSYSKDPRSPVQRAEHAFLLDERGRFRRIDVRGATVTLPAAINNRGQVVGEYVDRAGISHGYLQDADGGVTTIDAPGAGATIVTDVDDRGRVVGNSVDPRQTAISAFVREPDGRFTTIAAGWLARPGSSRMATSPAGAGG